jgi:hypothetical protein
MATSAERIRALISDALQTSPAQDLKALRHEMNTLLITSRMIRLPESTAEQRATFRDQLMLLGLRTVLFAENHELDRVVEGGYALLARLRAIDESTLGARSSEAHDQMEEPLKRFAEMQDRLRAHVERVGPAPVPAPSRTSRTRQG